MIRIRLFYFLKYINRFGFFDGVLLFLKIYYSKSEIINSFYYKKIQLRNKTSDIDVFNQVIVNKEYDFHLDLNPHFIIDAGANIGLTSLFFSYKYPQAKILAIEPEINNYNILINNTKEIIQIIVEQKAVWFHNDGVILEQTDSKDSNFVKEVTTRGFKIGSITIDEIIEKYSLESIDLLKLDIEGAEKEIFQNNCLWLYKVKTLVIELHDRFKPGCAMNLFSALNKHKYTLSIHGELLIINLFHFE
jgi:FkbM family methyltransferase